MNLIKKHWVINKLQKIVRLARIAGIKRQVQIFYLLIRFQQVYRVLVGLIFTGKSALASTDRVLFATDYFGFENSPECGHSPCLPLA